MKLLRVEKYWNKCYVLIEGGWLGGRVWHLMTAVCFSCFLYSYFVGVGEFKLYDCIQFWTVFFFFWSIFIKTQPFFGTMPFKWMNLGRFFFFFSPIQGKTPQGSGFTSDTQLQRLKKCCVFFTEYAPVLYQKQSSVRSGRQTVLYTLSPFCDYSINLVNGSVQM